MPPPISDDEQSDVGDVNVPVMTKRGKTSASSVGVKDEEGPLETVKGDLDNGPNGDDDGADEDEDDEDMEEGEYIVEKILSHIVDPDGTVRYEVKWEGYEKKSDRTWETTDNLRENASEVLEEYLRSVGGEQKIIEEAKTAMKTKKRGRPSSSATPANSTKKRRNGSHPASSTPPASGRPWKPPVGSWEEEIESIDACHDENTGKLIVYLTWKNGQKTQHDTKVIYQRCPQKMLQFYERHVKIVKSSSEIGQTDD
ncbi:hypothetical protein DL771_002091 [Monosporascus sp. 5C6A]|nr:hypothetical protein DL771_002091 [Monosporascus sp. 5C6A]